MQVTQGLLPIDDQKWYLTEDGDSRNSINTTAIGPKNVRITATLNGPQKIVAEMPMSLASTSYKLKVCGGITSGALDVITANILMMQTNQEPFSQISTNGKLLLTKNLTQC